MKFIVDGGELAQVLTPAVGVVPVKSNTMPIIEYVYLSLKGNTLSVRGTDLETTIFGQIELPSAEEGEINAICLPAKQFMAYISQVTNVPLTFIVSDDYTMDVNSAGAKYCFQGYEPDDYPKTVEIEEPSRFTIGSSTLVKAINYASVGASDDDLRPQMTGVLFEFSSKGLTFVGTDARKLIRFRVNSFTDQEERRFILPKKTLASLQKILSSINEEVEVNVEYDAVNLRFCFKNFIVNCRLIEGKYPMYEQAIPNDNPNKLIVNTNAMLTIAKRIMATISSDSDPAFKLSIEERRIKMMTRGDGFLMSGKEELPCHYEGETMEIGLNLKMAIDLLSIIDTDDVCLRLSAPDRPCIIEPYYEPAEEGSGETEDKDDLIVLLMPLVQVGED